MFFFIFNGGKKNDTVNYVNDDYFKDTDFWEFWLNSRK